MHQCYYISHISSFESSVTYVFGLFSLRCISISSCMPISIWVVTWTFGCHACQVVKICYFQTREYSIYRHFFYKKRETRRKSENVQTRSSVIKSKYILQLGNQNEPFLLSANSAAIFILATLICRQTNRFSVYTALIFQRKYSYT